MAARSNPTKDETCSTSRTSSKGVRFTLETSGGPSRVLWFTLGAVSGFIFATGVAIQTLFELFKQGVVK